MAKPSFQSCIDACNACATACDHCAASCLREDNVKDMSHCVALDIDCSQICRLAAGFMARNSELAGMLCETCAEVCDACGDECERYEMPHCRDCAAACRRCAEACRQVGGT